jgi:hypothetical protein
MKKSKYYLSRPWQDCANFILDKLWDHPLASHFNYPLDQESLGDYYETYIKIIKRPMDMTTVYNKLNNNEYATLADYTKEMLLIYSNAKEFNEKGSELHEAAAQLEEYFKILLEPIKKANLESREFKVKFIKNSMMKKINYLIRYQ